MLSPVQNNGSFAIQEMTSVVEESAAVSIENRTSKMVVWQELAINPRTGQ